MPGDTEQLVISLEARVNDFEKNFKKAARTANDNFSNIEKRAKQSSEKLESSFAKSGEVIVQALEGAFKGLLGGGILAAGVTAAATAFKEVAASVAEVGRESQKAGVSSKVWQQWSYVAKASGASIDGVTDGMKELNIRSAEFSQTGTGSASDAFKKLGLSAADVGQKIKDPTAFLDELIGKLQKLSAADRTYALDDLFGGTGAEQISKVLDKSVGQIQKLRGEAATFTDDEIASAKKIDAAFETMWQNVMVYSKAALVDAVGYAEGIVNYLAKIKVPNVLQGPATPTKDNELQAMLEMRAKTARDIANTESSPDYPLKREELRQLRVELSFLDDKIDQATGGSKEFKQAMAGLSESFISATTGMENSARAAANFKSALAELKKLVPDLKAELDTLAAVKGIDASYLNAVNNAQTMGQVYNANSIADQAKTNARVGAAKSDTNTFLEGHLAPGKTNASVEGMQSAFAQKLATMFASMPDDLRGQISINSGYRDMQRRQELWLQALKKYGSPEAARKWVAPPGNSQHNKGNAADLGYGSDAAMKWAHENAGQFGLQFPLGNENWHVEDTDARNTARSAELDKQTEAVTKQNDARKELNRSIQENLNLAQFEQTIQGMSKQQQAVELDVFKAQQDARKNNVTLSDQELDAIRQKITLTGQLNAANKQTQVSQEGMKNAQNFFAESFASSITGLIQGTTTFQQALQNLVASIASAALQAALLGQGPLAGLLGTGKGGAESNGSVGGILGLLFSADGGPVNRKRMTALHLAGGGGVRGPGTSRSDSIPAMLSDGEFVVNASATSKNRAALEAINSGKAPKIGMGKIGGQGGVASQVNHVSNVFSPTIPITVQASGNQDTDGKLSAKLQTEMDTLMDNKMAEFARNQQRPGGTMNNKRFI